MRGVTLRWLLPSTVTPIDPLINSPSHYPLALSLLSHPWSMTGSATAQSRLAQIKDFLTMSKNATTIPFDPDSTKFPRRKDVPKAKYGPEGVPTAWVWGEKDMVNVLSFTRRILY